MNLFGKKKTITPTPIQAIQSLKDTLQTMEKREEYLEKQITLLTNDAKKAINQKNKPKAVHCLKKRKLIQKQVDSIFNTKLNIDTQIIALTQAVTNSDVIKSITIGKEALKNSKADPDKVADVMDELEETLAEVDEITDVMSRPIGQTVDDDELLDELERELEEERLPEVKKVIVPVLPSVPQKPVKKVDDLDKDEVTERELRELQELDAMMHA